MAGISRDALLSFKATVAARLGTSWLPEDIADEDRLPRLPPLDAIAGALTASRAGDDICGHPTFCPGRPLRKHDGSFWCDDVDVWCWMGTEAPAGRAFVRLRGVTGSCEHLLPRGAVRWCRSGDAVWIPVETNKETHESPR